MRTTPPSRAAYNEALGMTVNQLLFEHRMTRKELAAHFGVTQPVVSRKMRGEVSWTAEELSITAGLFGLRVEDFAPTRTDEGWVPGPYVPGSAAAAMEKAPVRSGAEAAGVPPVGLEPTTFGLKVRSSDQLS